MWVRSQKGRSLVALGAALALGGTMARVAIALAGLTTFAAIVAAVVLGRGGSNPPLELVPALAASTIAWGAGLLLAFAGALRALYRDRDEGLRQLARARGGTPSQYLWARLLGLAAVLFVLIGGGALASGLASVLAAREGSIALSSAQGTLASLVYAAGFATAMAPIAFATLGARSRTGGYFGLLALVFLPELMLDGSKKLIPEPWGELASIPSVLASLRGSLMPDHVDLERFLRALVVLLAMAAIAIATASRQVSRVDEERIPFEREKAR